MKIKANLARGGINLAIVGATGAVGAIALQILQERKFPIKRLRALASSRSLGATVELNGKSHRIEELTEKSFRDIDIAIFSAGGSISEKFAPIAASAGAIVIDNSSAFRMNEDVPLVVPEVNSDQIANRPRSIIANPNCSTIQMVTALKPLHDIARIRRIVVSTYQAVSGAGRRAIEELSSQTRDLFNFKEIAPPEKFAHQIAFNTLPHIDVFLENGYTKEEIKMVNETRKILNDQSIRISATAVRAPVFNSHSESVNVEFERAITPEEAREALSRAPGVTVIDEPMKNRYPTALDATGKDNVFVGRIRADESVESGLNLWIVADNLRKGAALNAIQIAEKIIETETRD